MPQLHVTLYKYNLHLHPHLHHLHLAVDFLNIKVTIIVMMRTTMQDVNGMVEIAVGIMS